MLVETLLTSVKSPAVEPKMTPVCSNYAPSVTKGVSLPESKEKIPVQILRDTGSSESFILQSVLPFSDASRAGLKCADMGNRTADHICSSTPGQFKT